MNLKSLLKYAGFVAGVALWTTVCFVVPDFLDNPLANWKSIFRVGLYIAAFGLMHFFILYLTALNKYVFAVFLPLFAVSGSIVAYYRVAFHAKVTPMIIEATLHTNAGTVAGVVSWQLIVFIVFNLLVAVGFIIVHFKYITPVWPIWQALVVVLLIPLYYHSSDKLYRNLNSRYPMNIVHSVSEYIYFLKERHQPKEETVVHTEQSADTLNVIVILGEAMRADHLSLNGYKRATTPLLENRPNVISLPYIYSEHTYTSTSLPHLLTCADSITPELAYSRHSFIQNFAEHDYFTVWLSNQDYGRTYMTFINEADTVIFPNASKTVSVFDNWDDLQLLPYVDDIISENHSHNLYVLHSIGSHWYYNVHVPESLQIFQPVTTDRVITANTTEQIVNSYDNTALALDAFVDSLIMRFENTTAILFYQSDHGESLGENGNYLHAAGAEETKYPAAVVWYSDRYAALFPDKIQALKKNSQKRYRTDYFFYSVLSAAGMRAEGDNGELDLFSLP